jgi:hypothetical protein
MTGLEEEVRAQHKANHRLNLKLLEERQLRARKMTVCELLPTVSSSGISLQDPWDKFTDAELMGHYYAVGRGK